MVDAGEDFGRPSAFPPQGHGNAGGHAAGAAEQIDEVDHCRDYFVFSSSRATLWLIDDPYRYQLLDFDDLVDPDVCLAFPHRSYPSEAVVPQEQIRLILDTFKHLRFADDTIYLRAGSVNIFNGMVGLNFSCDGSHYIPAEQFLARDSEFWEGIG